jgi:murein DD-endopeptidase
MRDVESAEPRRGAASPALGRPARFYLFFFLIISTVGACSTVSRSSDRGNGRGTAIARAAAQLVGTPYHFGGADAEGFDCSGLVAYVHQRAGLAVPRTADEQRRAARPVPLDGVLPGDVVFFRTAPPASSHIDHVGIYAGSGRFIHAPHSGETVSYASLKEGYYRSRLVSAGRFWDSH